MVARIWLMHFNEGCSLQDAIDWVTRRMPKGLRDYYKSLLAHQLEQAIG